MLLHHLRHPAAGPVAVARALQRAADAILKRITTGREGKGWETRDGLRGREGEAVPLEGGTLRTPAEQKMSGRFRPDISRSVGGQPACRWYLSGAGDRTRTGDNHVGNVELYQLSYSRVYSGHEARIYDFNGQCCYALLA